MIFESLLLAEIIGRKAIKTSLERAWTQVLTQPYTTSKKLKWQLYVLFLFFLTFATLETRFYLGIIPPLVLQTTTFLDYARIILFNLIILSPSWLHWQSIPFTLNHPQMSRTLFVVSFYKILPQLFISSNTLLALHSHRNSSLRVYMLLFKRTFHSKG